MDEVPKGLKAGGLQRGIFEVPSLVAAAHELKSPMALIRQLALEIGYSPERAVMLAEQIRITSERGLRLTTDVTRHARLEDGMFELEPLNPRAICEQVIEEIQPLYRAHDRVISISSGFIPAVIAHQDLLRRILLSFADNALQYAPSKKAVIIRISRRKQGRVVRLSVRDHGPLVDSQQCRALRAGIVRGFQPLSLRPGSSGLGLATANGFARAMRADIGMTRHRDGMTFFVDIAASTQLSLL